MPWKTIRGWKSIAVVGTAIVVWTVTTAVSGQTTQSESKAGLVKPPATDAEKLHSAMSAGLPAIAKDATIMDMPSMKILRQGTNGWTCIPDAPTPGVDPMCLDKNGMEWADALMHH